MLKRIYMYLAVGMLLLCAGATAHHLPGESYGVEHYLQLIPRQDGLHLSLDLFLGQMETVSIMSRWDRDKDRRLSDAEKVNYLAAHTDKYRVKLEVNVRAGERDWQRLPVVLEGGVSGTNAYCYLIPMPNGFPMLRIHWIFTAYWPDYILEDPSQVIEIDYKGDWFSSRNPLYSEVVTGPPEAPAVILAATVPTYLELPLPPDVYTGDMEDAPAPRRIIEGAFRVALQPQGDALLAAAGGDGAYNPLSRIPPSVPRYGAMVRGQMRIRDKVTEMFSPPVPFWTWMLAGLLCFLWGSIDAFSPGHGKAIVSTYLIGMRAKYRHAFVIGGIVTVTHTVIVIVIAGVAVLLGDRFTYPDWLRDVGALFIVLFGINQIRIGLLGVLSGHLQHHGHHHEPHADDHAHDGEAEKPAAGGIKRLFSHRHAHAPLQVAPDKNISTLDLVAVGLSGGLVPCPSGIILLLLAIQVDVPWLGLFCVASFSLGLASILIMVGTLAVAGIRRVILWANADESVHFRLLAGMPALAGLVLVVIGTVLLLR